MILDSDAKSGTNAMSVRRVVAGRVAAVVHNGETSGGYNISQPPRGANSNHSRIVGKQWQL